mmetsp:Transcript_8947/g.19126  ORF Transcript_8947/g.19126 Transcript_8947/m.19126 type:complete len:487 (-) Transcript_8947:282-1742(-)
MTALGAAYAQRVNRQATSSQSVVQTPTVLPVKQDVSTEYSERVFMSSTASTTSRQHADVSTPELSRLSKQFHVKVKGTARFSCANLDTWLQRGNGFVPPALVWTKALQNDIHSVASEAGLSMNAATAIVTAASRGAISCNPGILMLQILRFTAELEPWVGHSRALQMVRTMPTLLNHAPENLRFNYEALAPAFGQDIMAMIVTKAPQVLVSSPFTVWSNLSAIMDLLRTDLAGAVVLMKRQPRLLVNSPAALRSRFYDLEVLFGLGPEELSRLIRQQPSLLSYFPVTLHSNMCMLAELLGLSLEQVAALAARQPSLVMLSGASVASKVQALAAVLGCGEDQVAGVVLRQPSILTLSSSSLSDKVQELSHLLHTHQEETAAVVCSQPALLTLSVSSLREKLEALRRVAALRPEWREQLSTAAPQTLASWLCFSAKRHQRFMEVSGGVPPSATVPSLPKLLRMPDHAYTAVLEGLGVGSGSKVKVLVS